MTLMEVIAVSTSMLLAILTAIYVILTYRLVRESKRTNDISREASDRTREAANRQFQLATFPYVHCVATYERDKIILTIQNLGSIPASDVDVLAVASYSEHELQPQKFIDLYVDKESTLNSRLFEGDEFYGVYDHMLYYLMPPNIQVKVPLHLPIPTDFVHVLLQFRDIVGVNYYRLYWFFAQREDHRRQRFQSGSVEPQTIELCDRIVFDTSDNLALKTEDGSPLPKEVQGEFLSQWNASIPSGYTGGSYPGVEDRGRWENL